ncbi:ABC transporter ATP-binding protein [Brucella tritici]|uniref:ABC transporter ATP-binding protein n=1 Tax=Brucella tritici TaxID=94626 RepID=A0A7V8B0S6_9HYPH|nr:ABC transporter ATP-binding protein [Brucella tritici]KAB2655189.1 ABC transporter ATP-binding protein [Brucella tritici]
MTNIHLCSVTKTFLDNVVLEGVSLDVRVGETMALLGPSGCGKTTLLRLIAGFERPDEGNISIGPVVVDSSDRFVPAENRHVGYVPQEGSLFPHLTVAGNIGYGVRKGTERIARTKEMLHLIGLEDSADKYPRQLSGGQQQRVALARALAPRPSLILLDEPFSALDIELRRRMSAEVMDLLRNLGTTTLLVTHDPAEAFSAADRVAVMQRGRVLQCGSPEEVYWKPASREAALLTGNAIFLEGKIWGDHAETVLGRIPIAENTVSDGTAATVFLRPEQIQISSDGKGALAIVHSTQFLGKHTGLTVSVDGFQLNLEVRKPVSDPTVLLHVDGVCRCY